VVVHYRCGCPPTVVIVANQLREELAKLASKMDEAEHFPE
jgi:hypothetical protein